MAKKRKSRAAEAPQEPEPVQHTEPEPEPEPEQPEPEEASENEGEEEMVEESNDDDEEEEEEEEEELTDDVEEQKIDAVSENNEQKSDNTGKPSASATIAENISEQTDGKNVEDLEVEPLEKILEPFTKDQLTLLIKEAVAKHPDVLVNVHKLADVDPAHRKIFVHGLGWEASAETVTSVFGKYGEIEDCKLVKDKVSGKSKGYAFLLFKHREGARRALKEPQKLIEDRLTSCQLASAGPVQAPPPTVVVSVSGPPASEYTQRKIYVSNVAAEIDTDKLTEFFSQFGEIEEGPLGLDKQTGKPRGFCLFVYKTLQGAKKALEDPHKTFEGHTLHCQKAVDGPKPGKGGFFQQHSQPQMHQQHHHHHHHQGRQGYNPHPAKKGRYAGNSRGGGRAGGHLMAPSAGPAIHSMGFSPAVAPAAIGQAVAALLASQGAGLGIGNLLGGIGAGMNPQGVPPMMNNAGYGGQGGAGGYGHQPAIQGGYGGQQQMGQPGTRPPQGGAPYMGHGL